MSHRAEGDKRDNLNSLSSAIVKHSADGILLIDGNGVVRFANPAGRRLLQAHSSNIVGQRFPLTLPVHEKSEIEIIPDGGDKIIVEISRADLAWRGETFTLASLRDITDHKRASAELWQKAGELEARNAELDAFSHTVAHQIRGLLSQIIGFASYAEMYYSEDLNDELKLVLSRILRGSRKMNNVMQELLLLASVRNSQVSLEPLNMSQVVSEACKRLNYMQDEYAGEISVPDTWPEAQGHPVWIEEVWVNYISNGLKYGGEPPRLTLGSEPDGADRVRFWVRDNGSGLTRLEQKRLFKPHTRLKRNLVRGEGLGLSIVWRIVEKCGGRVGVDSEPGQGSTFWFTLPSAGRGV